MQLPSRFATRESANQSAYMVFKAKSPQLSRVYKLRTLAFNYMPQSRDIRTLSYVPQRESKTPRARAQNINKNEIKHIFPKHHSIVITSQRKA